MKEQIQVWKMPLVSGIAFGVLYGIPFGYFFGLLPPRGEGDLLIIALLALATGGAFGLAVGLFANSKTIARQTMIHLPDWEVIEYEGAANHFLNAEARGGRLYLTDKQLIFQPHKFNLQSGAISVPRSDIASVSRCMSLGMIPNGILLTRLDGTKERFVVSKREEWIRRIAGAEAPV